MKTLKQIFREQRTKHYRNYGDTIPYDPMNGVKEWLQQKLYPDPKRYELEYIHNMTIKELLKEC